MVRHKPPYWRWLSSIRQDPEIREKLLKRLGLPTDKRWYIDVLHQDTPLPPDLEVSYFQDPITRSALYNLLIAFKFMDRGLDDAWNFQKKTLQYFESEARFKQWVNYFFDWSLPKGDLMLFFKAWAREYSNSVEPAYYIRLIQNPYAIFGIMGGEGELPNPSALNSVFWKVVMALESQANLARSNTRAAAAVKHLADVALTIVKLQHGGTASEFSNLLRELGIVDQEEVETYDQIEDLIEIPKVDEVVDEPRDEEQP